MTLYHVLNRGVEKRKIFMSDDDRVRFVHDLYEFNKPTAANNTAWRLDHHEPKHNSQIHNNDLRGRYSRLVDIHAWVLMGNHYHLLLSECREGGLSMFLMRLNVGYAKFFNEKYKRSGTLFQGRTKKIPIVNDAHYLHILHYIHLNPLDFLTEAKEWRTGAISNVQQALTHLDTYRWSSYFDYCGRHNFPSILTKDLFEESPGAVRTRTKEFLKDFDLAEHADILLE